MASDEETEELRVEIALLRSSLLSVGEIIEACKNVIEHPESVDDERRQTVLRVLEATLENISDLLKKVPVRPTLSSTTGGEPSTD